MEIDQEIIDELERIFQDNHSWIESDLFKSTFDLISYKSEILEPRAKVLLLQAGDSEGNYINYPALLSVCGADSLKQNKISLDQILETHPTRVIFIDRNSNIDETKTRLSEFLAKDPILKETLKKSMRTLSLGAYKESVEGACILLESLAEIIYPHEFEFGHEGRSWS